MSSPQLRYSDEPPFDPAGLRIAVTGAAGFIGGTVAEMLVQRGAEVIGLDIAESGRARVEALGAKFVLADVAERSSVERALEGGIDAVVHTAAIVSDWTTMEESIRVNVGGTANVLTAARAAGASRAVHLSSVVLYGYDDPSEQDEDAPRRSVGIPYLDTKAASDRLASRLGAVVVRPGDVYGPGSNPWTVRAVDMVTMGLPMVPSEDGTMLPVYIDDLAAGVLAALEHGRPSRAYAIWDGVPVTFRDYYQRYADMAGGGRVRVAPRALMSTVGAAMEGVARLTGRPPLFTRTALTFVDRRGTVSTRRAREELGWEPRVPLEEGLARSEAWLREKGLI